MDRIKLNNCDIAIEEIGNGQPVIFIHTILGKKDHWDFYFKNIPDTFKKIRFDLRGHGKSELIDTMYNVKVFAEDLHDLITKKDLKNIILIGHSVGALTVLQYLEKFSGLKIDKVVLLSCSLQFKYPTHSDDIDAPHDVDEVNRFYASFFCQKEYPAVIQRLISDWKTTDPLTYRRLNILRPVFPDFRNKFKQEDNPFLIIHGSNDRIVSVKEREELRTAFKNSTFCEIENAGHFVILEEEQKVCDSINNFLNK